MIFPILSQEDEDEAENVELEPEIKTAASLSHAMLQQLTVSVRLFLLEQISKNALKIMTIKMSISLVVCLIPRRVKERERGVPKSQHTHLSMS